VFLPWVGVAQGACVGEWMMCHTGNGVQSSQCLQRVHCEWQEGYVARNAWK
jgi:hypothetical protein